MKFITSRDLRLKPGDVWKLAQKEEDLVVTANGRPVALLTGVSEDTLEEELDVIQRARALRALDEIHRDSVLKGTDQISFKAIESEIAQARRRRKN
ncbi:MAG: type II toxin-antitoxin system prevent-host-death family antitoxin [Deltaproteobacteria bacterium]|nr:type II toxin-antitoxin system prevent-host-death family antitoxin [Deltaproteobacteria bacterium]